MENSTDKFVHQIETKKISSHFFKFLLIGFYVNYISLFSLLRVRRTQIMLSSEWRTKLNERYNHKFLEMRTMEPFLT